MRVAALQFDVRADDFEANLVEVERGLRAAAELGARLLVLPELWPTSFTPVVDDVVWRASERATERLAELSAELELVVSGSSYGRTSSDRPANRLTVLDRGRVVLRYDKVHLFSPTAEGETFEAGSQPPRAVDTSVGRLAAAVCYDLRFPELLRVPFREGARLVLVSAQWPEARASQWRALVLGRAVEGQCFVVGCNRTGAQRIGRKQVELVFTGNSIVASPHGEALAEGAGPPGLVWADLDLEEAGKLRRRLPIAKDERPDLYREW